LLKFLKEKIVDKQTLETEPKLYKLYRRSGRNDVLTMIKTLDLCAMSFAILNKYELQSKEKEIKEIEDSL
jgi:hypothetical protein